MDDAPGVFVPWKRVPWNLVLDGSVQCNHLMARSGLIRKDRLLAAAGEHMPPSAVHGGQLEDGALIATVARLEQRCRELGLPFDGWIAKPTASSNGSGIRLFPSAEALLDWLKRHTSGDGAGTDAARRPHVLQPCIRPMLVDGRKFGLRALLLIAGATRLWVYPDVRALLASEPYSCSHEPAAGPGAARWTHLTNRGLQQEHPAYDEERQNRALHEVLAPAPARAVFAACCAALRAAVDGLLRRGNRRELFALPNTFEVFGADFLVDAAGRTWLLEVNADPALAMFGAPPRAAAAAQAALRALGFVRPQGDPAPAPGCDLDAAACAAPPATGVWRRCAHPEFHALLLGPRPLQRLPAHWVHVGDWSARASSPAPSDDAVHTEDRRGSPLAGGGEGSGEAVG